MHGSACPGRELGLLGVRGPLRGEAPVGKRQAEGPGSGVRGPGKRGRRVGRRPLPGLVAGIGPLASSAGGMLLVQPARATGLGRGLSRALGRWRPLTAVRDPGRRRGPTGPPVPPSGPVIVDLDATVIVSHSPDGERCSDVHADVRVPPVAGVRRPRPGRGRRGAPPGLLRLGNANATPPQAGGTPAPPTTSASSTWRSRSCRERCARGSWSARTAAAGPRRS